PPQPWNPNPRPRTLDPKTRIYSYLSATIGSTFAARRAGTKQAARATPANTTETATNVIGSVAVTLTSRLDIKRVRPTAATTPTPIPAPVTRAPCPTTIFNTSVR